MEWSVTSPDGQVVLTVEHDAGELAYRIAHGDPAVTVIAPSRLGLETTAGVLAGNLSLRAVGEPRLIEDRYALPHGKRRERHTRATERTLLFGDGDAALELVVRVFDDAAAFRYRVAGPGTGPMTVTAERTEFRLASTGRAWIQPHQSPGLHEPAYEEAYRNAVPIGDPAEVPGWVFPALFAPGDRWVLITEADLDGHYCGCHLGRPEGLSYPIAFPDPGEADGVGEALPVATTPWHTPWRVVIVGGSPGTILGSDVVRHLSRPSRFDDTSWVRPGRAAWSWWADHESPQRLDALAASIDFCAEMGWEHCLIDANWDVHPDEAIRDLVAAAAAKAVSIWLWYNSGGPNNRVTEAPRDRMYEPQVRRAELAKLAGWGVAGVKVDFFHSDKQAGIRHYLGILEDAAAHRIMVNFHGCTVPRGWDRTWPHLMTMEAVRGAEQYAFRPVYPNEAPWHNTVLPFTRNVPGPMDYTPVAFSDSVFPHLTTNAHELALCVVFESGVQHFADSATSFRDQPAEVVDFLRQVPAVWDDVRHLSGEPGDHVVLARRHGEVWYVAGINGTDTPRPITLPLGFLTGNVDVLVLGDGEGPRDFSVARRTRAPADGLDVAMAPYGGFAARLAPAS